MAGEAEPQRQARGRQRAGRILDAADGLIRRDGQVGLSLQQVAEAAGIPPASLYHYFPTPQALLTGLAQRYIAVFETLAAREMDHGGLTSWSDLCARHAETALGFYHEHPVAMRLFLGPESGWEIRHADLAANRRIGGIYYRKLIRHFAVAESAALEQAMVIAVTISDAIWAMSFARTGEVEPAMAREALRARLAYLRLYVGEYVEKRARPLDPAA
ncbi:TetR/AcrR family transcriptional regulator [Roseococcus thiosulfatophilus]|uniref:TetR/AcrR family transcriptional regulator n=1 Tax=Roseococcus thiosulfatophilus TaxID=35813 RepID=UPI001A8C25BC|nr:TetR/AcrR family transcriptional regulator [Roseococcus thiosulfatophilus]